MLVLVFRLLGYQDQSKKLTSCFLIWFSSIKNTIYHPGGVEDTIKDDVLQPSTGRPGSTAICCQASPATVLMKSWSHEVMEVMIVMDVMDFMDVMES